MGEEAFYINNFANGGFVIISADKRMPKVLAYSNTGAFKTENLPWGITAWLEQTKYEVGEVRKQKIKYTGQNLVNIKIQDKPLQSSTSQGKVSVAAPPTPPPGYCEDTFYQRGPLVQTSWTQDFGYNAQMQLLACGPDGRAFTGCVATAMAQIIRYRQYPASYNYSIMPNNLDFTNAYSTGAAEIARLMKDAAQSVNATYNCDGTSAVTEDAVNAFKYTFGYSSTVKFSSSAGDNWNNIKSNLDAGWPVILKGGTNSNGNYINGHAWVCDGYNEAGYCSTDQNGNTIKNYYTMYHMNWGWGDVEPLGSYDGWFYLSNMHNQGFSFNYKTGVILNLHP